MLNDLAVDVLLDRLCRKQGQRRLLGYQSGLALMRNIAPGADSEVPDLPQLNSLQQARYKGVCGPQLRRGHALYEMLELVGEGHD